MDKPDLKALESEYRALFPKADSFCGELINQINRLLKDNEIVLAFPIQHRVKTWDSLAEKFESVPMGNLDTVKKIQDLVGLRLILLFKRDIPRVIKLISSSFSVVRQYDTQERLKEDQFGYSSVHLVIELPKQWLAVPTMAQMGGLKAEIQVRTTAQHMWAEVSHTFQYKRKEGVPPAILRSIYRVSALLETVDLEFERMLGQRESYRNEMDISGKDDRLNVDNLEKILDSLLPAKHKVKNEHYGELLGELDHFDIVTQKEVRNLIEKHLEKAMDIESEVVTDERHMLSEKNTPLGTSRERLEAGLYFNHSGLVRVILRLEFGARYEEIQADGANINHKLK
jgi:GTP pyrophosphokinase